jgi:TolB-like protein
MLPRLAVPDWAMTLVVVFAVLGFPIALVLGWALEVTPDGVKVTRPLDAMPTDDPPPALLGKRTVFAAALLVVLGVGIGAGWFLRPVSGPDVTPPVEPAAELAADAPLVADRSIAVLPFVNMSADPEQEYFSDGLSEEILNLLAQIRDLRVIGRTSSFAFKGRNEDLRSIGSTLGVAYLLEGSVRKAGDDLRITAQLIEVEGGSHLWSQSYDRRLENVFAIQTEIAGSIAEALRMSLVGPDQAAPVAQAAASLPAYDLFLQARRLIQGRTRSGIEAARKLLDDALALDPDYAPALAAAAQAVLLLNDRVSRLRRHPARPGGGDGATAARPGAGAGSQPRRGPCGAGPAVQHAKGRPARRGGIGPGAGAEPQPVGCTALAGGRPRQRRAPARAVGCPAPAGRARPAARGQSGRLAWTLLDSGEPAEAEAVAVRLQRAFPDNPQGFAAHAGAC